MKEEDYGRDLDREVRLVLYIPVGYMKILDVIKGNSSISKKGIVIRALRDYFYKHRKLLNVDKMEEFLIEYLEGR
ncbi:unnamed protein product [marine sediment metagenome]|uniref:Uncharacterized protein n=1 Tax=marine sediment metagenome TaxID=412755 RepID=X1J4W6_9ZZZZ